MWIRHLKFKLEFRNPNNNGSNKAGAYTQIECVEVIGCWVKVTLRHTFYIQLYTLYMVQTKYVN